MATHSSNLAWRIPWTEETDGLQFMGWWRAGHDWVTNTFTFHSLFTMLCQSLLYRKVTQFYIGLVKCSFEFFHKLLWNFLANAILITTQYRRRRRCRLDPLVRKIPWRREWQPTPVFLPGEFHGQKTLVGYSPQGHKELNPTEQQHIYIYRLWYDQIT